MDNWRDRWYCWDWASWRWNWCSKCSLRWTNNRSIDALDLDNITFDADEDAHVSSGEELDEEGDDDGDNDIIRGLEE